MSRPRVRRSRLRARPRRAAALAAVAVAACAVGVTSASGSERPGWTTVATGFRSPLFGLTAAPGGRLLVADAGAGPTEVRRGVRRLVAPLPGVTDVIAAGDGDLLATTGGGPPPGAQSLYRISHDGRVARVANLLAFEQTVNPDGDEIDSNPFDLERRRGGKALVADAAGNSILVVDRQGRVDWVATLPERLVSTRWLKRAVGCPDADDPADAPLCALPARMSADPVPTTVAVGPDGAIYVGELRGFPATPGTSRVWRIRPGARHVRCGSSPACRVVARGFTSIIDIAFGRNGKAYVVELDERSWLALESGMGVGGTVNACRPHRHEWRCSAKARELPIPTAVAVRRNRIFVTLFSLVPGRAQVARLR